MLLILTSLGEPSIAGAAPGATRATTSAAQTMAKAMNGVNYAHTRELTIILQ